MAEHFGERLDAGAWGFLDLLRGRPLLRTPALTRIRRRLRAEGRDDLADSLLLVEGPLRRPDAARQDAASLARLRDPAPDMPTQASQPRPGSSCWTRPVPATWCGYAKRSRDWSRDTVARTGIGTPGCGT